MKTKRDGIVLVIAPLMDYLLDKLSYSYRVIKLYECESIKDIDNDVRSSINVVVTRGDIGVSTTIMETLPNLALISVFGVGTDAIDKNYTKKRNIEIAITAGVLTQDVADMALALLLNAARKINHGHWFVQQGRWKNEPPALGTKVSGKKIGIVGMGNIGEAIAQRANAFDMEISYYSRTGKNTLPYQRYTDLVTLAQESDFLVISASGGADTLQIINAEVIAAMPKHAWIINISRGSLIDEEALITALKNRHIAGAALDVFLSEPNISEEFLALDNVLLQPHVGSATHETRKEMCDVVYRNIQRYTHF